VRNPSIIFLARKIGMLAQSLSDASEMDVSAAFWCDE